MKEMKHYYFDRGEFCATVKSVIDIETLYDATMCYGEFNQRENFAWFNDSDEYYIVHKPSGMMINWYKHLGRTNACNQEGKKLDDIKEFFKLFKEDLKEWIEDNHYVLDDNRIRMQVTENHDNLITCSQKIQRLL